MAILQKTCLYFASNHKINTKDGSAEVNMDHILYYNYEITIDVILQIKVNLADFKEYKFNKVINIHLYFALHDSKIILFLKRYCKYYKIVHIFFFNV